MTLLADKIVVTCVLLVCGAIGIVLPSYVAERNKSLFSLGNTFASGVLLGAGLLHQLADAADTLHTDGGFPWANLICGSAFLLFLVIEEAVHVVVARRKAQGTGAAHAHGGHAHAHAHGNGDCTALPPAEAAAAETTSAIELSVDGVESAAALGRTTTGHVHDAHLALHLEGSLLASMTLLTALCVHSVIAGVSLGLESTEAGVLSTGVALGVHKLLAAWALGVTFHRASLPKTRSAVLGAVFVCSAPLGAVAGMLVDHGDTEGSKGVAVVSAVVAGTFLYIAIVEIGMKARRRLLQRVHLQRRQVSRFSFALPAFVHRSSSCARRTTARRTRACSGATRPACSRALCSDSRRWRCWRCTCESFYV